MKKSLFMATVSIAAVIALSACGSNNNNNADADASASAPPSASASAPASEAAAGGQTIEVTINASNWKFDTDEIKAKAGDTLKLTLKNADGVHGIVIEDLNNTVLKNGETVELKLDKAGTYEYHCNITCGQGHDNMSGNIIVE